MAEAKFTNNQDEENFGAAEEQELGDILDQLSEVNNKPASSHQPQAEAEDIIQKPTGSDDQPDDIEGLLEKISEKPEPVAAETVSQPVKKPGFFKRILNFFK